jgi:protein-tyrosine phosphatase
MHFTPWLFALVPLIAIAAQAQEIAGALNFRDIGGLPAASGQRVRHGIVYRSGELNTLTEADLRVLAGWKIRYIFDARTDAERAAAPMAWTANPPVIVPISVGFDAKEDPARNLKILFADGFDAPNVAKAMRKITARVAVDGAPAIGQILHALAQGEEPAIIHCTAGKDRTGVVIAVLLTILGVPKEAVYDDYLRSNAAVAAQTARLQSAMAAMPPDTLRVLMGVDRSYLDAAFEAIDDRYGDFDKYVHDAMKLTPEDVASLRTRLLEPAAQ